jgi:hypothetical protein
MVMMNLSIFQALGTESLVQALTQCVEIETRVFFNLETDRPSLAESIQNTIRPMPKQEA